MRREDRWMAGRQKTFNLPRNATGKQQGAHKSPHHLPRLDTMAPRRSGAKPRNSAPTCEITGVLKFIILSFTNHYGVPMDTVESKGGQLSYLGGSNGGF